MQKREEPEAKYVYCIISGDQGKVFGREGIGGPGNQVYTIPYRDISAVVSDTPLEPLEPTTEHVLAHEGAIEEVMAEHTVLPLRFGVVFASEARVKEMLEENYPRYQENLARLHGKVELGLKVLWEEAEIRREVERASERVARFREELAGRAQELKLARGTPAMRGRGYYLQMKLEKDVAQLKQLVREEMETTREREALHVFKDLRGRAVDACLNRLLDQRMILNAAFLVGRGEIEGFSQRVEELKSANAEKGMEFALSGPWPPYNFIHMEDKRR
ncbi:MAG: GvpL/GvpF family gas vesicle protein [Anaerolineae bacterium]|nr:GvpL/GvpF family gas vesicle protein [Anaerolineae bacterium]